MKYILFVTMIFLKGTVYCMDYTQTSTGKIIIPYLECMSNYEYNPISSPTPSCTPPSNIDMIVGSTVCRTYNDFKIAIEGTKDDLINLIVKENALITAYTDANDVVAANDARARKGWLIYLYKKKQ